MTFRGWYDEGQQVNEEGVPHEVRAEILRSLAETHGLRTFVETGTAMGAMLESVLTQFARLYSVEMDPAYYEYARDHVGQNEKVSLELGHSVTWLAGLLDGLSEPALVYLDAHYSGPGTARGPTDTPILAELLVIFRSPIRHLIVVDDARGFGQWTDYPTLAHVEGLAECFGYQTLIYADQIELNPGGLPWSPHS